MKRKKLVVWCFLVIFYILTPFSNAQSNKSSSGIYMSVSGRVINIETGNGVPGVRVLIYGSNHSAVLKSTTDKEGNFIIRMVPAGIHEIADTLIHNTCPEDLIIEIDAFKREFKVENGKNIHGLDIYLY